jgi:hypothetical protein
MSQDKLIGIARLAQAAPELQRKHFATYSQLSTFKLLNRCDSKRVPFDWTINPYRGCEFGCVYCYARYTHEFMELRDPVEFENKIFAKQWNPAGFRADVPIHVSPSPSAPPPIRINPPSASTGSHAPFSEPSPKNSPDAAASGSRRNQTS